MFVGAIEGCKDGSWVGTREGCLDGLVEGWLLGLLVASCNLRFNDVDDDDDE